MVELADWQISLISAVAGGSVPLVFVFLREWLRDRKAAAEVRNVLGTELELVHNTLSESLKLPTIEQSSDILIAAESTLYEAFPLDTTYYENISVETLAKSLGKDVLS